MTYVHIYSLDGQLNLLRPDDGARAAHSFNDRLLFSDLARPTYGNSIEIPVEFRANNFTNAVQSFPSATYVELAGPITTWRPNGTTLFFPTPVYDNSRIAPYSYVYTAWAAPGNTNTPLMLVATETIIGTQIIEWFFIFSKSATPPLGDLTTGELLENVQGSQWEQIIPSSAPVGTTQALGLDTLPGADGNLVLTPSRVDDTLVGGEGDDDITGSTGRDSLVGAGGSDTIRGGGGNDTILGGNGNDLLYGDGNDDLLNGGTGRDTIFGGGGNDTIFGGDEGPFPNSLGDFLYGEGGNDVLDGGRGHDFLEGGADNDTVNGGEGNDTIVAGPGTDWVIGGPGTDTLLFGNDPGTTDVRAWTISEIERVVFSTPEGPLFSAPALTRVGVIADSVAAGLTEVVFATRGALFAPLTETLRIHTRESLTIDLSDLTLTNMEAHDRIEIVGQHWNEALTGTQGRDVITGDSGNDTLSGEGGADLLSGGADNDWITPGAGSDTVDGGAGVDMVSFVDLAQRVVVDLGAGTATSGADTNILSNIENVTGTIFGDLITGDAGANRLRGLGDYDWFVGSDGADTIDGGVGRDMVAYSSATSGVWASLVSRSGTLGQANGDSYIGIENLTGSSHADRLTGDNGRNLLRGLGGDDFIFGNGGNDTIDGGTGRDVLSGGNGNDRITGGRGNDTIDGGFGWDTAIYSGRRADYNVVANADGSTTVSHARGTRDDGIDLLLNVEVLQFSDGRLFV